MTQDVDVFAMTVSYREDPPFVVSPLEPDNGDGAGGELLGEEVDCIEVELTGSLYDLFKDGCTFGELGSFVVGCMAVTIHEPPNSRTTTSSGVCFGYTKSRKLGFVPCDTHWEACFFLKGIQQHSRRLHLWSRVHL
jgi:hypothetical protein